MFKRAALGLVAGILLCTSGSGATALAAPGASTAFDAVQTLIKPFFHGAVLGFTNCKPLKGSLAACPVTPRFRARLQQSRNRAFLLCRCLHTPATGASVWQLKNDGSTAQINVWWNYPTYSYTTAFIVVRKGHTWLVDDQYCTPSLSTSIYKHNATFCH